MSMTDGSRASGYGTVDLDVVATEQAAPAASRAKRAFAGFVVVGLCVAAMVALSGSVGTKVNSAVNANRYKLNLVSVDGIAADAMIVSNLTLNGLRWSIYEFKGNHDVEDPDYKPTGMVVTEHSNKATEDWNNDWREFRNAMPKDQFAMALYNFEFFIDNDSTDMETVLISWIPTTFKKHHAREVARAGYFLGSVIIATDDFVDRHVPIETLAETYDQFCIEDMKLSIAECSKADEFVGCPYNNVIGDDGVVVVNVALFDLPDDNPCVYHGCSGGKFERPEAGETGDMPVKCCTYIPTFCEANPLNNGCDAATNLVIDQLCEQPVIAEEPDLIVTPEDLQICDAVCGSSCLAVGETAGENLNRGEGMIDTDDTGGEGTQADMAYTWKLCSGCKQDREVHDMTDDGEDNGFAAQCYPGGNGESAAVGFLEERCCGIADVCNGHNAESVEMVCNALEYYDCIFTSHLACPAHKDGLVQKEAPTGCCESYPVAEEVREYFENTQKLEHTFQSSDADDVKSVSCGKEFMVWGKNGDVPVSFTTDAQKALMNFVWHAGDDSCEVIQGEYQAGADDEAAAHELRLAILANITATTPAARRMAEASGKVGDRATYEDMYKL